MINVCQKGKRVERELVTWLKSKGISSARRTRQYNGEGLSDVVAMEDLPNFHIECKGVKAKYLTRTQINNWAEQLKRDCPTNLVPVLFCKRNNIDWIALCPFYVLEFKETCFKALGIEMTVLEAETMLECMRDYENDVKLCGGVGGGRIKTRADASVH